MAGGLFLSDCSSSSWSWLDIGCDLSNVGQVVGNTVTSALEPVWIILGIAVIVILILAFAPNVPKIIPHLRLG